MIEHSAHALPLSTRAAWAAYGQYDLKRELRTFPYAYRGNTISLAIMPAPYHPPVKRSVEIAGHKTSISLEPLFWDMLRAAAERRAMPISALVARIDEERIASATPCGLAGAIRLYLVSGEAEAE